jgi:hypothetical protein
MVARLPVGSRGPAFRHRSTGDRGVHIIPPNGWTQSHDDRRSVRLLPGEREIPVKARILVSVASGVLLLVTLPGAVLAQGEVDVVQNVDSVVAVVDPSATPGFPAGSLMRAVCGPVVNVAAEDGSSQQLQTCSLSDEPVMIPENQGTPPEATVAISGGECEWTSDYWFAKDESIVMASAFEIVITPSGRVFAWSEYPAEPLDCPEA